MTTRHRPSILFTVAFVAVTLLEIWGEGLTHPWLHYTAKPLIMLSLMGWTLRRQSWASMPGSRRWLLVGMGFALAGDMFLMLRSGAWFAAGLGSFLVMQLCYVRAFYGSIREANRSVSLRRFGLTGLLFALYSGGFLYIIKPSFDQNPANAGLWIPVIVYVLCISTMGLMAALRRGLPGYGVVLTGAILFIASDSGIAISRFVAPFPLSTLFIMGTYAAAQYLIVTGMMAMPTLVKPPTVSRLSTSSKP